MKMRYLIYVEKVTSHYDIFITKLYVGKMGSPYGIQMMRSWIRDAYLAYVLIYGWEHIPYG